METDISEEQLFHILNKAIKGCTCQAQERLDTEANKFVFRYMFFLNQKSGLQQNMFGERLPDYKEVRDIAQLCENLEAYRCSIDVYAEENEELSEMQYRHLYEGINKYRENIFPENIEKADRIKLEAERHLPEFKTYFLLQDSLTEAQEITKMEKSFKREQRTSSFFNETLENSELKDAEPSAQKLQLYQVSLSLVNYLPDNSFRRIEKFELKVNLNTTIRNIAQILMNQENDVQEKNHYQAIIQEAENERQRFQVSIDNMHSYKKGEMKKRRPLSVEEINRRAMDEWINL